MAVMGEFAALAMLLAGIGTYGVISYGGSQRAHELGVRRALGARAGDVVRLVTVNGMRLALTGVVLVFAAGCGIARFLNELMIKVNPADPATFVVVTVLAVSLRALAACLVPARRASRIDPLVALRSD